MSKVMIRGSGYDTVVELDGRKVDRLVRFQIIGDGLDHLTRVIFEIDADVDFEGDVDVEARLAQ